MDADVRAELDKIKHELGQCTQSLIQISLRLQEISEVVGWLVKQQDWLVAQIEKPVLH